MGKNLISIGNCGEYFVAAELERHGFTVAVPMSNVKDFDILAINRDDNSKQYAVQVKTQSGTKREWTLSKKNESMVGDNIIYVFVILNGLDYPKYYIVPSKEVADTIKVSHQKWIHTPGKNGQSHNDNNMRKFVLSDDRYLNNWEIL